MSRAEDIQTSSFYVNQNFDYSSGQSKPTGWRVSNTVTVRVKPDLVSAVIDAGSKAGANIFNSISFDLSNREELKARLMKDAVANARAKALGTLEGTTHTLGDIVAIAADWSGPSVVYCWCRRTWCKQCRVHPHGNRHQHPVGLGICQLRAQLKTLLAHGSSVSPRCDIIDGAKPYCRCCIPAAGC